MTQLSINTTQNVNINFIAASVGDRILAQLLDLLVKIAYGVFVFFVVQIFGLENLFQNLDQWSIIAIISIIGLPVMFYSIVQESLWEGQTIGKKIMKLKVIKLDGYQAGFGDYLIRWLFRLVEVSIGYGVIALIAIISSKKNQRLGDMAAGTAIITLKNNININHTIIQDINADYVPTYPLVIKLSDNDVRIVKETFEAAIIQRDYVTIVKLREKIVNVTGIKNQSGTDSDFIRTLLKDYNYYTQNM
ncbi:RDD family protein [Flavobacterium celericrescens]|uniref:RDD family protein n=1 Tax=Flavobacterium celericrescens TaxID=2709780 RepID=A0ABX0ICD7_9FLAO|nr:RDD family protein [Flavobacterium celericrescens]NHM03845.1 RDD family protein [Flavobacterium celericrescens]